jgi:hypothetical protein
MPRIEPVSVDTVVCALTVLELTTSALSAAAAIVTLHEHLGFIIPTSFLCSTQNPAGR